MQYCSRMQRQAKATATDPAHLSPSRGDTLPTASKPPPPLDWPSALGDTATKDAGAGPGNVLSGVVGTWSVDAAGGNGSAVLEAQAVPQIYRLLEVAGARGPSAASSDSND
jgi:hypothetical protein